PTLLAGIANGNFRIMAAVLHSAGFDLMRAADGVPLADVIPPMIDPLSRHVLELAGIDPDQKSEPVEGERVSYADYYDRLYRLATGWLEMCPEDAWNSSPRDIVTA